MSRSTEIYVIVSETLILLFCQFLGESSWQTGISSVAVGFVGQKQECRWLVAKIPYSSFTKGTVWFLFCSNSSFFAHTTFREFPHYKKTNTWLGLEGACTQKKKKKSVCISGPILIFLTPIFFSVCWSDSHVPNPCKSSCPSVFQEAVNIVFSCWANAVWATESRNKQFKQDK